MKLIDILEIIFLAGVWGSSFLFLRIASPEFGPFALVEIRILIGGLVLLPFILLGDHLQEFKARWKSICILAVIATAIPFPLFSYTTLYASSGYTAILNATTLMFASLIAFFWLKDKLGIYSVSGIFIGFFGVVVLTFDKQSVDFGAGLLPTLAALLASFLYGITACYTRKFLLGLNPLITATGSQLFAAIILLPLAILTWPEQTPSIAAWLSVAVLGILCTAIAYLSYFRLVMRIGVTQAVSVSYLIPLFGVFWGYVFLDESITTYIIIGGSLILISLGLINKQARKRDSLGGDGSIKKCG